MPAGRRAFCSPTFGGVAWGRPKADREVIVPFPHSNFPDGRSVAVDVTHNVIASTRIKKTQSIDPSLGMREVPVGEPCRFGPTSSDAPVGISVCSRDWHAVREVQGMRHFFASTQKEWFDPARYPCPDLAALFDFGK
jgi:hypothetical protein